MPDEASLLDSKGAEGRNTLDEIKEFELHRLHGFNALHWSPEAGGEREGRRLRGLEGVGNPVAGREGGLQTLTARIA